MIGQVYEQAILKKVEPDKDLQAEMLKRFEPAAKRYPSDPRMYLYLGEAHAGLKDKQLAQGDFLNALKLAQKGKGSFTPEERKEFIEKVSERMKGI